MDGEHINVDMLDKMMTHIPGRIEWDGARFHYNTQNNIKYNTENS